MTNQQGRDWSQPYKKPNEINGRNIRSQLVATVKMSNDFNVATGRNTHPIYYVYRRAALGAAGTSLIAIIAGRSIIQTLKFITTFLNPSSWWKTGQRIRFVVNRVVPSIGLNVTFCSLSFLRSVIHPSLFVFRSADSDGWSQCRSILGRGRRAVGGYAFALCNLYQNCFQATSSNAAIALSNFGRVFFKAVCAVGQTSLWKATYSPLVEWAKTENLLPISSIVINAYSVSSKTCRGNQPNSVINPLVISRFGIGKCTNGESESETSSAVRARLSRYILSSAIAPRKIDVCFASLAESSRCLANLAFKICVKITPPKPITPTIAVWNSLTKHNNSIGNPFGGTVQ